VAIYGVEVTYQFGNYKFEIGYDSDSETGLDQRSVEVSLRSDHGIWSTAEHLRTFYYEDVNYAHVRAFCKKFAENADYRAQCLAGTTDWGIRDSLFRRNIGPSPTPAMQALGDERKVWQFVKLNWKAIVSQPEHCDLVAFRGIPLQVV